MLSPRYLVQKLSISRIVVGRHPTVSDAHAREVDPHFGRTLVLFVDPPGDGGNEPAGVGLAERVEVVRLKLGEEGEPLLQELVQVVGHVLLALGHHVAVGEAYRTYLLHIVVVIVRIVNPRTGSDRVVDVEHVVVLVPGVRVLVDAQVSVVVLLSQW